MSNVKRNSYMDFLKGVAIVAVIVGHTVSGIPRASGLYNIVYSFHMPLLMFISAYIEEQNKEKYVTQKWKMLLKRVCGLLIPYLSWTILYKVIAGQIWKMNVRDLGLQLLGYKQSGLWFLPVLFGLKFCHFLYWVIQEKIGDITFIKDILICCILEIAIALLSLLTKQPYIINMLSYAIPYFFAIIIVDHEILQKVLGSEWVIATALLIYVLVFPHFSFHDTHWTTQVIRIGLSLCVIVMCYKLQENWEMNPINKILCLFGSQSLVIYLLHGFFIDYISYINMIESTTIIEILSIFLAFVIAGICILVARIIELSSWWKRILFGK